MSGIMSMFSNIMSGAPAPSAAPAVPATPTPATPGQIPAATPATGAVAPSTAPNGVVPSPAATTPQEAATPLTPFADLWNNAPQDPNSPASAGVFGNLDPKKFMEAAGKIDFTKVVTPEQLQSISQGGEAAVGAFAAALNAVAQTTYAQSAFASTKIVEQALARAKDNLIAELPQHIKKQTVSENLRAENPIFQNPAVRPVVSALEAQLAIKFPQASSSELTSMAKQYIEALGTSFAPAKPVSGPSVPGAREETDWSTYLP